MQETPKKDSLDSSTSDLHHCLVNFDGDFMHLEADYVGYSIDVGTSLFDTVPADKVEFVKAQLEKIKKGESVHYFVSTTSKLEDNHQWETWGQPCYVDGQVEPHHAEFFTRELTSGNENNLAKLFREFYKSTDDQFFVLSDDLKILDINHVKSTTKGDFVGKDFRDILFDGGDYLFFLKNFEKAKNSAGKAIKVTHPVYINDKVGKKYCSISFTYLEIDEVGRYILQVRDIHKEHMNEVTLRFQEKQLEEFERWRSMGQMSAGIAHEINNPLCIIRIQAEQMKDRLSKSEDEMDSAFIKKLTSIVNQVERIEGIANSLKVYSRSSNNTVKENLNLDYLLTNGLTLFQAQTGREVHIDYQNDYKQLTIDSKENEFYQILINLLTNSYQAVHKFKTLEKCWIKIWVERSYAGQYTIFFQDGGDPISERISKDMFTPFFTTKEIGEGTGLGLSISKKLAYENGMDLRFREEFKHTTFSLELSPDLTELGIR